MDPKTQKEKRRSPVSKNTVCQELIQQAVTNLIPFRFVLFDVWFASADTLVFIKQQQQPDFSCPLKTTRKVALSQADKPQGRYFRVDTLELEAQVTREVYLEGVDFPLVLVKQVCTNEDGSLGIRYLVSSDTPWSCAALPTSYPERWQGEVVSPVAQTERLVGEVPHAPGHHPNPSFLRRPVWLSQIGAAEPGSA